MTTEMLSVLAALISAGFALVSVHIARKATVRDRRALADEMAMRYRVPLLHAAFDLQTRLYNIGKQNFLGKFAGSKASIEQRDYAFSNTLYLVAQYLCFSEIIRRGMLYLDPVDRQRQRALMEAMEDVRHTFADTLEIKDSTLCVFRGEQRALGEVMLVECEGVVPGAPRWDCLGYASFVGRLEQPEFVRWLATLHRSLETLLEDLHHHDERLIELQNRLLDLVCLMDPVGEHTPGGLRERLARRSAERASADVSRP